jgi:transcriptional accessory protein Tex/SPT6
MSVSWADIAVAKPLKTVRAGDKVTVKVLRVDAKRQRIGLSIRQASDPGGVAWVSPLPQACSERDKSPVALFLVETPELFGVSAKRGYNQTLD